jgi:hypothetical protein
MVILVSRQNNIKAVLLNKKLPITSEARVISEPLFRLKNVEANTILEVPRTNIEALFDYDQPGTKSLFL